jgi:superfamily II DNA/RNA helicase
VDCVINFDLPLKEDDYIHRVGRTARAGGLGRFASQLLFLYDFHLFIGKSLTIVSQFDVKRFLNIEKRISLNL